MKDKITTILTASFHDNGSVNTVVKQDSKRMKRIERLMRYSYFQAEQYGKIYLTDDQKTCALVLFPHQKKFVLRGILEDLKLVFGCIGVLRVGKVMKREATLKKLHPTSDFAHLWYIGVDPSEQGKGHGTKLMQEILAEMEAKQLPVYLETSNPKNFVFYERIGFTCTNDFTELGYGLKQFVKN